MITTAECIPCMIRQGLQTAELTGMAPEMKEEMIRDILGFLQSSPWQATPPGMARDIYRIIGRHSGNEDPYKEIKSRYNREIMSMEEDLNRIIGEAEDGFHAAMKLAISGNLIDFGTDHPISREIILKHIETIENTSLVIDHSRKLRKKLGTAGSLLYLGDNCGEIVFDRIFIEYLQKVFPELTIRFGVRGAPIINDVTRFDARETGMDRLVEILDNGDDSPGTVMEHTSPEFRTAFYDADVVISKGQGNYETLNTTDREDVYLLFMAKCPPVARSLGVERMSLLCVER